MNHSVSSSLIRIVAGATVIALAILAAYVFGINARIAFASAPSGLPATVSTTSVNQVTPGSTNLSSLVFASSTCAARIITTYASNIMITFSDKQGVVPTGSIGHLQAASTTVAYDSGVYGCGALRVFSYSTSSPTFTETQ